MQSVTKIKHFENLRLLRPLLHCFKEDLKEFCQRIGQEWVEDPTNSKMVYSRNRIRALLSDSQYAISTPDILRLGEACRRALENLDDKSTLLLEKCSRQLNSGEIVLKLREFFSHDCAPVVMHSLVIILQRVGKQNLPPRNRGLEDLLRRLQNFEKMKRGQGTFSIAACTVIPAPGSKGQEAIFSPQQNQNVDKNVS